MLTEYKTQKQKIEEIFREYYKQLYSQPEGINHNKIVEFLQTLDLPSIKTEQNKYTTQTITEKEIIDTINKLKTNKAPGSDGFPAELYKKLKPDMIPKHKTGY